MTLSQAIGEIKAVCQKNRFVNSFYFGELSEWTEIEKLIYPNVLLILRTVAVEGGEQEVKFTFYLSDLLEDGSLNRLDVFSDTLQTASDILKDLGDESGRDWLLNVTGDIDFFDDIRGNDNADSVGGVKVQFSVKMPYVRDCTPTENRAVRTEGGLDIYLEDGEYVAPEA